MMFLRWALCAPLSLAANLFVMLTSPLWAAWAAIGRLEALPGVFALVHTHDDWIYGFGWPKPDVPPKFSDRFRIAIWWLCRNPAYGFDAKVLGFSGEGLTVEKSEGRGRFDAGEGAKLYVVMRAANGRRYFSWRRDIKLSRHRYIKVWFGWQHRTQAGWHILKFDINPFKSVD